MKVRLAIGLLWVTSRICVKNYWAPSLGYQNIYVHKKLLNKIHTLERGQVNWTERDVHYRIPASVVEQDSFIHSIYVPSQLTHTCTMVKKKTSLFKKPIAPIGWIGTHTCTMVKSEVFFQKFASLVLNQGFFES